MFLSNTQLFMYQAHNSRLGQHSAMLTRVSVWCPDVCTMFI